MTADSADDPGAFYPGAVGPATVDPATVGPATLRCDDLLRAAASHIGNDSPQLDAELLLAQVTGWSRTRFRAFPEQQVSQVQAAAFQQLVSKRATGEPVAYVLGQQEFWSLPLQVSAATLIPRPDTECVVEHALTLDLPAQARVLDLGTGTGAIALALASERPDWNIIASDLIDDAVALAQSNAAALNLSIQVVKSHWFDQLAALCFDLIVSNPPYIASTDHHLSEGDVRFEPASALVSGADGLDDIRHIVAAAPSWLNAGGWLLLEHGYDQTQAVQALLQQQGFDQVHSRQDYGRNDRMTLGQAR
ncbi:peptide chain release factor N(5)-glutamine methyltransferase [Marinobacter sp. LV10MA510-1]|uniref:peptide chain release factor N(5)-glutamine methyltransferase n=1 Tax=Marinobacter sp. LV10MA510-1 TaxID=1415567 RepID=UPI000C0124A4|nr:peptide chain release factor N(5)-glutamine methyltransferase [Marinobacter sp. LV10MA510-1]PFG11617.1 [protein release factor]-glutamine N5-methyltransferase (EC 211-) [Marinobacter sp. LV10MA510-1]